MLLQKTPSSKNFREGHSPAECLLNILQHFFATFMHLRCIRNNTDAASDSIASSHEVISCHGQEHYKSVHHHTDSFVMTAETSRFAPHIIRIVDSKAL